MASSKSKSSTFFRVFLFVLLILGLVFLVVDRRARSAAEDFKGKLDDVLPAEGAAAKEADAVSSERVEELAGRKPSKSYQHERVDHTFVEEYRWRGAFRSYTVYCYYNKIRDNRLLDAVSLNAPLKDMQL